MNPEPPGGERALYHRVPDFLDHWSPRTFAATAAGSGLALAVASALWLRFVFGRRGKT